MGIGSEVVLVLVVDAILVRVVVIGSAGFGRVVLVLVVDAVVVGVFIAVENAVVVLVSVRRIASEDMYFVAVVDTVGVGVLAMRARPVAVLAEISEPISIGIATRIGAEWVEVMSQLPPVGHPVVVGI